MDNKMEEKKRFSGEEIREIFERGDWFRENARGMIPDLADLTEEKLAEYEKFLDAYAANVELKKAVLKQLEADLFGDA